MTYIIRSLEEIGKVAKEFLAETEANNVFCFDGEMGAGKTTFIKSLCEALGVEENISSPTFSIVNEYETNDRKIIYHFDCYRISKFEDALNIGINEYLESGNICFIEWAENIAPLLPDEFLNVKIIANKDDSRIIETRVVKQNYF